MLDLQHLETFRIVSNKKSFTRAAEELGCAQSTVTTRIVALERELGTSLFVRGRFSKNVALTEAGRKTLEYAGLLLELARAAKAAVQVGSVQTLPSPAT